MRLSELLLESRIQDLITKYGDKLVDKLSNENVSISDSRIAIQEFNKNNPSGKWVFTEWLIVNYLKDNIRYEDLYKAKNYIPLFIRYNNELENRDILQYNTLQELYTAVEPFMHKAVVKDTRKGKEVEQDVIDDVEKELLKTKQAKIIYEDSIYKVVKINSYKASVYFGSGSEWCISNKDSDRYYKQYTEHKPDVTFVLIKNSNEKYAFLPQVNEFRDKADNMLDLSGFFNKHPKLIKILELEKWLDMPSLKGDFKFHLIQILDYKGLVEFHTNVFLGGSNIEYIPNNIKFHRNLDLGHTLIKELPKDLYVGGSLTLTHCERLKELPDELNVDKDLYLNGSGITKLPDNFKVNLRLLINNCRDLKELPDGLRVYEDLYAIETGLVKVNDNILIEGMFKLQDNENLETIGDNLRVGQDLDLTWCTGLTTIGKNLIVKGNLILTGCESLIEIPPDAKIGGNIFMHTNIKAKIPKRLQNLIKVP